MKKTLSLVALGAAAALVLTACGDAPAEETSSAPPAAASEDVASDAPAPEPVASDGFLACMVSDAGGFDDKSFNQSGYEGLKQAETDLGIAVKTAESKDQADYADNLSGLVAQGCSLTFTVGFLLADATSAAGEANPDSHFAIIDDSSLTLPNVKSLVFRTSEAAFLAGYLAAAQSESGVVATFGGMQIPSVTIFMDGFADGVDRYNADKGASVKLLGWDKASQNGVFTGDFDDAAKGQTATKTFIDQGADIVMPVAGPVGHGAIAAAREAGDVAIVWVDADGYETTPDDGALFLTSVVKEIGASVETTIQDTLAGTFSSEAYIGTLANGGVGIAPYHDFEAKVSDETKAEIEALRQAIIDGSLVIDSQSNP